MHFQHRKCVSNIGKCLQWLQIHFSVSIWIWLPLSTSIYKWSWSESTKYMGQINHVLIGEVKFVGSCLEDVQIIGLKLVPGPLKNSQRCKSTRLTIITNMLYCIYNWPKWFGTFIAYIERHITLSMTTTQIRCARATRRENAL